MNSVAEWSVARWAGALGIAGSVLQLLAFIPFFVAGPPPSLANAQKVLAYVKHGEAALATAVLLFFIGFALYLGFFAAFREVLNASPSKHRWLATATLLAGGASIAISYVGLGLAGAAVAEAAGTAEAASVRTLFEASAVLGSAPALIPIAFFLGVAGSAVAETRALPRWIAVTAWVASVLVFIASFSLYGGNDTTAFWSATGLVGILALLPLYIWTLATSIVLLRLR
jgi:hypothetical protein